ncbi:MAG: hypothetical protein IJY12_03575 [Clostridia bacterium]|nr:hypothetical protein [Clostridia bacterium]
MVKKKADRKSGTLLAVFGIGGLGYNLVEMLWRGRSHWSMTVAGGMCLCILYGIHCSMPDKKRLSKYLLSALSITAVEFAVGCVVNLWLNMNVWDYTRQPFNLRGQVCLLYSCLWFLISIPCDLLCGKIKKILG